MTDLLSRLFHQIALGDLVPALALVFALVWLAGLAVRLSGRAAPGGPIDRVAALSWQLAALLGLEHGYEFLRGRVPASPDVAFLHAYRLLDFEWQHGFFVEQ